MKKSIVIMSAVFVAASCLAGGRPYEFDWANRTADDRPVLLPLVSADGWTCETTGATACFTTACERVLFGAGVAHLAYKIPGEKGVIKLKPPAPEVFANLYNNQWNTNFPFWIPGSWTASLRVYPIADGADEEQSMFAPAWEIRQPCVAAFAEAADATRRVPPAAGGVALSRRGVRVTAFCPNPDGRGIVLRVWEQAGNAGKITVSLPKGMKTDTVQPVNLRGEVTGEPIAVKDGRFSFDLGAWAPKSFILHDGGEQSTAAYRFYRFSVDLTAGDAMQISELKLFDATGDITRTCAAVRYEEGTFSPQFKGYCPLKAVDGDLATKWYDDRAAADKRSAFGKDVWLVLEYAEPVAAMRYGTWKDLFDAYWLHYVKARIPAQAFDKMNENFFRTTFTSRCMDALPMFYSFETEYNSSEGRCDFLAIPKPGVAKPAQLVEFKYFTNAAAEKGKIFGRDTPDAETVAQALAYRQALTRRPDWNHEIAVTVVEVCGNAGYNWFDLRG